MMKDIQITDEAWSDFRHVLRSGQCCADVFMVHGSAEETAVRVQSVLEDIASLQATWRYFLTTGSESFCVPCYASSVEKVCMPEPLEAYHVTAKRSSQDIMVQERVVKELEQSVLQASEVPHFVVMEHITPPTPNDRAFTALLLKSSVLRQIPILIFLHEHHSFHAQPLEPISEELLCLLYLCGGRMRESEWLNVIEQSGGKDLDCRWITTKNVEAEKWFCYAHREVAELAEHLYSMLSQERKGQLAQKILHHLPNHTGYPLLPIASETGDLDLMLSRYSEEILEAAFLKPDGVARYLEQLQQVAAKQENAQLARVAYTNYLLVLLYMDYDQKIQIYQKQRSDAARSLLDTKAEATFWYTLGNTFALMAQPEVWPYAEDCFRRSRESAQSRYDTGEVHHSVYRIDLANAANGEALIAYKRKQGEKARLCAERAIEEIKQVVTGNYFQIHLRVNLGDVFFHLLGDTESAIAQYIEALTIVLHIPEKLQRWAEPRKGEKNELRAAQRLGDALLLVNRNEEAIQVFDALLFRLTEAIHQSEARRTALILKARLSLAQAHLKVGRPRSAAVCYLSILRQAAWLDLNVLQDAAERLRKLQPGLHDLLQRRIDSILALREKRIADLAAVQERLSHC
jgi:hypothetical protein